MDNQAQNLLKQVGKGKMNNLAYDTAWLARLGDIDPRLSYQALDWICKNQLSDGSWGAKYPYYYYDRITSTLAAMIALTYQGRREQDKQRIEKGLIALEKITNVATRALQLDIDAMTVGFEMIVPVLVAEAENIGIIKRQGEHILGRLSKQRKAKLALLKDKKISRHMTAAFSAEMAGVDGQSMLDIENLQEENGSIGHSPSATAYYALYVKHEDEAALKYLHMIAPQGGAPDLSPFDVFETTWVLWNLSLSSYWDKNTFQSFQPLIQFLQNNWKVNQGIGLSVGYSIPDGDDTALAYEVLSKFGQAPSIEAVLSFEEEDHFRTYHFEASRSASVNIHVLSALRSAGFPADHPKIRKLLLFLEKIKTSDGYWLDKWNLSPYYTTAHAIIACTGYADFRVEKSVEWILSTQRSNGAWGQKIPTAEETAYALQALSIWHRKHGKIPLEVINSGARWLEEHIEPPYPPLWIGKGLYCAEIVVKSAIISALKLSAEN